MEARKIHTDAFYLSDVKTCRLSLLDAITCSSALMATLSFFCCLREKNVAQLEVIKKIGKVILEQSREQGCRVGGKHFPFKIGLRFLDKLDVCM